MADQWSGFKVVGTDENDPWASFKPVDVGASPQAPAAPAPQRPTYSGFGEAAIGAGKALGAGLVRGAVGLGTLPGNLEVLGRAGINNAAG